MVNATSSVRFTPIVRAATPSARFPSGSTLRSSSSATLRDPRSFFRRAVATVSSSVVAYPHDDPTPAAVANASVDKVLRVEATRTMTAPSMRELLRVAYAREGAAAEDVEPLLHEWTFDLRRGDVLLAGYDGWRELTTFIPPHLGRIDIHGIDFMRATWRLFLAPSRSRGLLG